MLIDEGLKVANLIIEVAQFFKPIDILVSTTFQNRLIDFKNMSTCLGLFYAQRLEDHVVGSYLHFCIIIFMHFFLFLFFGLGGGADKLTFGDRDIYLTSHQLGFDISHFIEGVRHAQIET